MGDFILIIVFQYISFLSSYIDFFPPDVNRGFPINYD